jgi:hypothetical protein
MQTVTTIGLDRSFRFMALMLPARWLFAAS